MRKYNPALKGMVDNYRSRLEQERLNSTLNYTDKELFRVIEYWTGMEDGDQQYNAVCGDVLDSVKR